VTFHNYQGRAIAPGILAALQQIRQTVTVSQVFNPTSSDRTFAIGSSDYSSLSRLQQFYFDAAFASVESSSGPSGQLSHHWL
jgi:hypothetical protein